jgi:hypothetical protein
MLLSAGERKISARFEFSQFDPNQTYGRSSNDRSMMIVRGINQSQIKPTIGLTISGPTYKFTGGPLLP